MPLRRTVPSIRTEDQVSRTVIVSAVRTAIGTFGGALANTSATDLGGLACAEALSRAGVDPGAVDEVILGNVLAAGLGLNPARVAALNSGVPREVPSFGVNKACGSGLKAVHLAAQSIACGDAEVVVAGGMENMTMTPYMLPKARFGYRLQNGAVVDSMINDGLTCPITKVHMGITAENVAEKYGVSRLDQDEFAAQTQRKTAAAQAENRFANEIVEVEVPQRKGDPVVFAHDEFPRADSTAESLAKLRAAFKPDGLVTAGNSSGINDGAAAVVVMSKEKAAELGLELMATIKAGASAGVDPAMMGTGPIPATRKCLDKAG